MTNSNNHHQQEERTVILIKPDGVRRGLIGDILSRIEKRGLKIISLEMIEATRGQIDSHYPKDKEWVERLGTNTLLNYKKYGESPKERLGTNNPMELGLMVREWLIDFLVSGPMVKAVVEGIHAIDMVRKLCGNTLPNLAEIGTIRGDFSVDSPDRANEDERAIHNIIHASENEEEANHEMSLWFSNVDIHSYKRAGEDI